MSGSRHNGSRTASISRNGRSSLKVLLDPEEVKTLRAACDLYRHSIPVYLASSRPELTLLRRVLRKLR